MNPIDRPFRQALLAVALVVAALAVPFSESLAQVSQPPTDAVSTRTDDLRIAEQVRAALGNDSVLEGSSIKVASNYGMVVLAGTVRELVHIDRAVDVASRVPGVKSVSASIAFIAPDSIASLSRPA